MESNTCYSIWFTDTNNWQIGNINANVTFFGVFQIQNTITLKYFKCNFKYVFLIESKLTFLYLTKNNIISSYKHKCLKPIACYMTSFRIKNFTCNTKKSFSDTDDADVHKNLGMILITLFSYHQQTSWKDSVFVF